jgi:hypothetical protein
MSLTDATFQPPMLWLNAVTPLNSRRMLETAATFHSPMLPYFVVQSEFLAH